MKKKNAIILSAVIGCAIIALVIAQTDPTGDASNQPPTPDFTAKDFDVSDLVKGAEELEAERQKVMDEWNAEMERRKS